MGAVPTLSVVAPAHDEASNIRPLYEELCAALEPLGSWELILVDDASDDGTGPAIDALAAGDPRVTGIRLVRRSGQSAAVLAGAKVARASVVASLDADLQNDPADLPRLVRLLETSGADLVAGVREKRADHPWRRISSSIANRVRRAVLNERFRDSACGIKVVRRDAFLALEPFDGMHRFLPGLIERSGGLVVEAPVHHRPRVAGRSKYTTCNRLARATRDMLRLRAAGLHSSCRSST